jgi:hypothetical protein
MFFEIQTKDNLESKKLEFNSRLSNSKRDLNLLRDRKFNEDNFEILLEIEHRLH